MTGQAVAGIAVSRETISRLDVYSGLLAKWTRAINLISSTTVDTLWDRHIIDSAQIFTSCPAGATKWVDLGSGGGLPGLVVAILAEEKAPQLLVTLVESDKRKASFLRAAAAELKLTIKVEEARAETLTPQSADVVSARALAPLPKLLALADRHMAQGGRAIFMKGCAYQAEIDAALETWRFSVQKQPSQTDPDSVILCIEGLARV